LRGTLANHASCTWPGGASDGPLIRIRPRFASGMVDVVCRAEDLHTEAQVTFTNARILPKRDPYGGGVVLFKLRRTPRVVTGPLGRQVLGLRALDRKLRALGAWVFPAFPFDRSDTLDRVGLDRWIVVDLPEHVNFYQAVELLRSDSDVYAESYLPEDADFLRVRDAGDWSVSLLEPRRSDGERDTLIKPLTHGSETPPEAGLSWDLVGLGAPEAWQHGRAKGVGIAIVDTGVDANHLAISPNLRVKHDEARDFDADGNGIPGDWAGINFAHLAIVHGEGAPHLALGCASNVTDWDGIETNRTPGSPGHGTAIAAAAAGAGGAGGRLGVAPQAWILPVDVQENFRTTVSLLLEDDPRMRTLSGSSASLRSPIWARAAGVAYAVREGARVLTCAWPPAEPHWILHDVLVYAEENCVLPVCSSRQDLSDEEAPLRGYPARWRSSWLRERGAGTGAVYDAWRGEVRSDFFQRPLRGLLMTGEGRGPGAQSLGIQPDLLAPLSPSDSGGVTSAVSNPRNDTTPLPDRRTALFPDSTISAGLLAGAAALVTGQRPDLEPLRVRNALLDGARFESGAHRAWIPGALRVLKGRPQGSCSALLQHPGLQRADDKPFWQRVKIHVDLENPADEPDSLRQVSSPFARRSRA
jgi:hypothetical protein